MATRQARSVCTCPGNGRALSIGPAPWLVSEASAPKTTPRPPHQCPLYQRLFLVRDEEHHTTGYCMEYVRRYTYRVCTVDTILHMYCMYSVLLTAQGYHPTTWPFARATIGTMPVNKNNPYCGYPTSIEHYKLYIPQALSWLPVIIIIPWYVLVNIVH